MSSINKAIVIGHLGRDPEVTYTQSGQARASFTLATNENWKDREGKKQERTEWHRIVVWGKLAEICGQYLSKGRQCYIEGRLQTREWDDKDGNKRTTTEIVSREMVMLGGRGSGPEAATQSVADENPPVQNPPVQDDDIPF